MAAEGTLFEQFHTLGAECSPSRASWFTGRSPSDKAVRIHLVIGDHASNVGKGCADYLNVSTPTVPAVLKTAGYRTAHFGKASAVLAFLLYVHVCMYIYTWYLGWIL